MDKDDRDREAEVAAVLSGESESVRKMLGSFMAMRWGVDEVRAFLANVGRGQGGVSSLVGNDFADSLAEAENAAGRGTGKAKTLRERGGHVSVVRYAMSEEGRQYVRNLLATFVFVEYREQYQGSYNPHPILRAVKDIVDREVWKMTSKESSVMEVGPNVVTAVAREPTRGMYLGLIPCLDSLDAERVSTAYRALRVRLARTRMSDAQRWAAEDAIRGRESILFSRARLQEAKWVCDEIVALDSAYDIPLPDLVAAAHRCSARRVLISLVNLDEMCAMYMAGESHGEGRVGKTEMLWRFSRARNEVVFWFLQSSTRPYKHKLSQLVEYYRKPYREYEVGGERYLFQRASLSNEVVCVWTIDRFRSDMRVADVPATYHFSGDDKVVRVVTQAVDLRYQKGDPCRLTEVTLEVGMDSFTRVLQDRMSRPGGKPEELMSFIRTNRVNIVCNGVRVSGDRPVAVDALVSFSEAVDSIAKQLEKTAGYDVECVMQHVATGGWCSPRDSTVEGPGIARTLWRSLVVSMSEVVGASLSAADEVRIEDSEVEKLEAGDRVPLARCQQLADAERLEHENGGRLSLDEAEALKAYIQFLTNQGCDCDRCEMILADGELREVFFDAKEENESVASGFSDTSESYVSSTDHSSAAGSIDEVLESFVRMSPAYVDHPVNVVTEGRGRAACEEYAKILRDQMIAKESMARNFSRRIESGGGYTLENLRVLSTDRVRHFGVRVGPMGLIQGIMGSGPELDDLGLVYDPVKDLFFLPERSPDGRYWMPENTSSTCYSNDDMSPWLNPALLGKVEMCLADPRFGKDLKEVPFVNGIWGSGKSFIAKLWFEAERSKGSSVMFLGSSRLPTEKVREELFPGDPEAGRKWVRTIGSFMNGKVPDSVTHLVVDEVCMEHSAVLHVVLWLLKPEVFWVCGDQMQMQYVPFLAGCMPKFSSVVPETKVALLQKGHRAPEDVYAAGLDVYGVDSGIHPCDCDEHCRDAESMKVVEISSIAQVPIEADVKYLTHGQGTKLLLQKRLAAAGLVEKKPGDRVSTIAEFQGGTKDKVYIVRDVVPPKPGSLYHELKRNNVGVSRSTGPTVYYTASREKDGVTKLVGASKREDYRMIVRKNKKKFSGVSFGLSELYAFLNGTLAADHPALVAGIAVKERAMASL